MMQDVAMRSEAGPKGLCEIVPVGVSDSGWAERYE